METFNTRIPRELAVQYGEQAVQIMRQGVYRAPSGRNVTIADLVERSTQGTTSYPPEIPLPDAHIGDYQTQIEVANETNLAAVQRLHQSGHHPVALNFASATHPGGGFLSGALAQEEYLARSSGLYACLVQNPMYAFHRARHDPLYSDASLRVTMIRHTGAGDGVVARGRERIRGNRSTCDQELTGKNEIRSRYSSSADAPQMSTSSSIV